MKLFAWQPQGHGEYSWFVVAVDEHSARTAVEADMARRKLLPYEDLEHVGELEVAGWGTEYYELTVAEPGQVVVNDNS